MNHVSPDQQQRIDRVWENQQALKGEINRTSAAERIAKLKRLHDWILDNRSRIHQAVQADFQKPVEEIDLSEIWVLTTELKGTIRSLKRWMQPRPVKRTLATLTAKSWIQCEPKGVVLIISPWNYPFNLSLGPLISALAAGNCVVLKPSEFTPHSSRLMSEMAEELFPAGEVVVIEGDYRVAEALEEKPFDHIFFTGSPAVGKKVMAAAARHLSSVTLELGGKSPTLIDRSARLRDAATKIVFSKYLNSAQTCIAPDYILVHSAVAEAFNRILVKEIRRMFGKTLEKQKNRKNYGCLVNDRHFDRLNALLTRAREEGVMVQAGGETDREQHWMAPTVLTNVTADSVLMSEEIFGPLLPVLTFDDLDQALAVINDRPKPLALYVFSENKTVVDRVLRETSSGGACINDCIMHFLQMNLPFGGVNNSGIGKSHGIYGFEAFSNLRAVLRQSRISPLKFLMPPYNHVKRKLIKLALKYV